MNAFNTVSTFTTVLAGGLYILVVIYLFTFIYRFVRAHEKLAENTNNIADAIKVLAHKDRSDPH
jgi:hypothetical protein